MGLLDLCRCAGDHCRQTCFNG
uniref:Uncharacterized protein n=1 Tax=Anopheles arabiensis TaxID=7173 RepID=A0A182IH08_ANOAR